jgi:hypothetical protein
MYLCTHMKLGLRPLAMAKTTMTMTSPDPS